MSVSTGWIARLSAAIYTFVAFPLILRALGSEGFAIYLYATNFPAWLVLAMLGAQTAPAYFLSRSVRRGNSSLFRVRLGTALIIPVCLVVLTAITATVLILSGVVGSGASAPDLPDSAIAALLASLWLTTLLVLGGVFENMSLGLGRSYIFNFVRIAALSMSLLGLLVVSTISKNVSLFVFVSIAPQALLLICLGYYVMHQAHAMPVFDFRFRRHIFSRINTSVTSGFFLMSLPFVINVQLGPTILGSIYGATQVSALLVLLRVLIFVAAFFGAITASSWPILGHFHMSGDARSLLRNSLWLIGVCVTIIIVGFAATVIFGQWALRLWLPDLDLSEIGLIIAFAIYLSLYLWNTLWLAILCALGKISVVGQLSAIEALLGLGCGLLLFKYYDSTGYLVGLTIGTIMSTSTIAPIQGFRTLVRAVRI